MSGEPSKSGRGIRVEVHGLHKSFSGRPALRGVELDIHPGELFVIMGPSGSGKSVLLKHIIGLETPDEGSILIDGKPIHQNGVMDQHRLAMVFQSGALLNSLTIAENVGLYLSEHRLKPPGDISRIVREKLELVGLKDIEDKLPNELSGGMRKRAAIARALVIEPQLVLYDEPTSELDPVSAITIGREIDLLNETTHATSVVVTHDRDLAFGIAGRIAFISEGEILQIGTPAELRNSQLPAVRNFLSADFKHQASEHS